MGDDIYKEHGFKDRTDYLHSLADEYGMPLEDVIALADILGQDEDFDQLVISLEDRSIQL